MSPIGSVALHHTVVAPVFITVVTLNSQVSPVREHSGRTNSARFRERRVAERNIGGGFLFISLFFFSRFLLVSSPRAVESSLMNSYQASIIGGWLRRETWEKRTRQQQEQESGLAEREEKKLETAGVMQIGGALKETWKGNGSTFTAVDLFGGGPREGWPPGVSCVECVQFRSRNSGTPETASGTSTVQRSRNLTGT